MSISRYFKIRKNRIPKRKRTIAKPGAESDTGKYFKCWNCGFTCNTDRDVFGDSGSNESPLSFKIVPTVPTSSIFGQSSQLVLDSGEGVLMKLDATGAVARTDKHNYAPLITIGCPLCGTLNWK